MMALPKCYQTMGSEFDPNTAAQNRWVGSLSLLFAGSFALALTLSSSQVQSSVLYAKSQSLQRPAVLSQRVAAVPSLRSAHSAALPQNAATGSNFPEQDGFLTSAEKSEVSVPWAPLSAFFAGCLVAVAGLALRGRSPPAPVCTDEWSSLAVGGSAELAEIPEVIGFNKDPDSLHRRMEAMLRAGQDKVCKAVEDCDGGATFQTDAWIRAGSEAAGGGGISRVLTNGNIWEKAGVNLSVVWGQMPQEALAAATEKAPEYIKKMGLQPGDRVPFFVAGLSCVMHPRNPHCPTMHFNYRYFELDADNWWFGGGTDITPAYLDEDDMKHFHGSYKKVCDKHDKDFYPTFKKWADKYFLIKHRGETRGLGGIFFDDLNDRDPDSIFKFCEECLANVVPAYIPIIEKHKNDPFTEEQKRWQLLRRGRYAEFNLVYDRGTLFGLRAGGRIESILMTIPEVARWEYAHKPAPGSEEEKIMELFKNPRDFV